MTFRIVLTVLFSMNPFLVMAMLGRERKPYTGGDLLFHLIYGVVMV